MRKASIEGTQNVAAVQLGDRQEVERSSEEPNPGGTANGMQQEHAGVNPWMQDGSEESQKQWSAESQIDIASVVKAGDNFGVEHAVGECRNRQDESYERTGSTDVK